MEDRWHYCSLLSDKTYKHYLIRFVFFNMSAHVSGMCTCNTHWKKPQEEHMKVLTVVLSKGHNSGNFNFLLFVFSDHVLICFGKMTKHLKTSHYLKKAA